ncbi:protein of unassigned function [Methylobacterium oryzae CBMB20]|uniref:Protein of unassigned function n=1 Tax=Methylobacterium oryzae CBMB20 TaxID=693986 RepID=A0A089P0Y5_9HYPH|nr:protein of unassigned function [Methylobacterium oryzae CBMB20]
MRPFQGAVTGKPTRGMRVRPHSEPIAKETRAWSVPRT